MPVARVRLMSPAGAVVALCFAAFAIAACSGGGAARKRDADGRVIPTLAEQDPSGTLYAKSVNEASSGTCSEQTLNVLTCFAYRGHGYEGAQTALGQCLISTGEPAEGLDWVRRAADAGWPDAQKLMTHFLLDGETVTPDMVQAAKWGKLYTRNPSLLSLGVIPDRSIAASFEGRISQEQLDMAERLAADWRPTYWRPTSQVDQSVKQSCEVEGHRPRRERPDAPIIMTPDPY